MKTSEKNEIIDIFVNLRKDAKAKYQALVKVLLALSNSTPAQKRYYNASIYSPLNLSGLEYDIKKLCGITDSDISRAVKTEKKTVTKVVSIFPEDLKNALQDLDLENADYNKELRPLAKQLSKVYNKEPESQKKPDLIAFIEANFTKEPTAKEKAEAIVKVFEAAPNEVKTDLKLRDEFPFLSEDDCPNEFKILVADKLTAFKKWLEGREELKALVAAGATNEDIFEIAKTTVANFELNLEIYDELEYYKEHGTILGKHEIFADKMLEEGVANMSTVELTKRQKNLRTYVSKDEKALNKMEEGEAKEAFTVKVEGWKTELALVDARLEKIS